MQVLEDKILREGEVRPGNVLKVDGFLNHLIDINLLGQMADELNDKFYADGVTKVLTIEASGIALATAVAERLGVPILFAKKSKTSNLSNDVYTASVHSFTHNTENTALVSKKYLNTNDNVLIVDDFLANGCAVNALISIVEQAGAKVAGVGIAVEKGFQGGGDALRQKGVKVVSLAIVQEMSESSLTFRHEEA